LRWQHRSYSFHCDHNGHASNYIAFRPSQFAHQSDIRPKQSALYHHDSACNFTFRSDHAAFYAHESAGNTAHDSNAASAYEHPCSAEFLAIGAGIRRIGVCRQRRRGYAPQLH
jgi:hypothetical protein